MYFNLLHTSKLKILYSIFIFLTSAITRKEIGILIVVLSCSNGLAAQEHDPGESLGRSRNVRFQKVTWKEVDSFSFDSPADITGCPVPEGAWEVSNGTLRAVKGDRNRAILLLHTVGDTVRIEFDATNTADDERRLGDITVLLNSVPGKNFFRHGYSLTTSSYWNSCTTFYKKGKPIAKTEYTPVISGKKHHVVLEFNKGHIRYWLDDQIILEAWDDTPLMMDSECWIGIRTWATLMEVDNVVVYKSVD